MKPYTADPSSPLRAAVLGCTGSVGRQALEVLDELGCRVVLLSAGSRAADVERLARKYRPEICTMDSPEAAKALRLATADTDVRVYGGGDAACRAIGEVRADLVIHAVAGLAGLPSALAAAETGARLGIANKEAVIAAGGLIFDRIRKSGGELIPLDSEHSAIFQCLAAAGASSVRGDGDTALVRRILLTASGGPFFGRKREELFRVTPEEALRHPTWRMGPKITVDCATLMNKGFEIMEAVRLFGVTEEKVEVLVHRQSIIHSMVEYIDHTVIAQLGAPDMRACIRYAVTYPTRAFRAGEGLDFTALGTLTLEKPDIVTFPLLDAAREAIRRGGTAPTALIAADEEAVAAFLAGRISFPAISDAVREAAQAAASGSADTPDEIFAAEADARRTARRILADM